MDDRFGHLDASARLDAGTILDLSPADMEKRSQAADGGEFAVQFSGSGKELDGMSQATIGQVADLVKGGRHVNLTVSGRSDRGLSGQERAALERDRIRTVVAELLRHGISKAQASLLWQSSPKQAQLNQATMGDSGAGLHEIARIRVG